MAAAVITLDSLLQYMAERVDQNAISPRFLKYVFLLFIFVFSILGVIMEPKNRTRISVRSLAHLSGMATADVTFVLLGTVFDYLAQRFGKKRVFFTILLLPTNTRIGLVVGFLLDICLSPPGTSFIFRLAFLVPVFIRPTRMVLAGEPVDEIMVDPILAGVPILTYLLATWLSYDPTGVMSILSSLWQHQFWVFYIPFVARCNWQLIYYGFTGTFWLLSKPIDIVCGWFLKPLLKLLGTKLAARRRRQWSYAAIYPGATGPYQYKPLKEENQIRLLRLWPRGPLDGIFCELRQISLDSAPFQYYEAMSYTWGNPTKSHSITVDGHEVKVTKNVYDLLYDHSSSWKHKNLWIDSICINQEKNDEKSKQILLMKKIYQRAFRVVVYLGNDPDSCLAINLLRELRLFREYCPTGEEIFSKYRPQICSRRWLALIKLFSHNWFERVWVIQEVVVASNVAVRYGGTYISWKTFTCAVQVLTSSDEARMLTRLIQCDSYIMQNAIAKISHIQLLARSREDFEKGKPTFSQDVMFRYATFKATDDRDKVYALLGCVSNAANIPPEVLPDYSKSPQALYLETANILLSLEDPTLLLAHAGIGWARKFNDLPSWVPDWTSVDGPCTLGGPNCGYRAAGSSPFFMTPGITPQSKGFAIRVIDTLSTIGSPNLLPDDLIIPHILEKYSGLSERQIYKWVTEVIEWAASKAPHRYQSREELVEAIGRTLICDMNAWPQWEGEPTGKDYREYFKDWMTLHAIFDEFEEDFENYSAGRPVSERLEAELQARFEPGGPGIVSRLLQHMKWMFKARAMSTWRRFCVTESGYIGLVPPRSKLKDFVVIISGVKTPFVLRQNNSREESYIHTGTIYFIPTYSIVGECYIHEIMYGEMSNPDLMHPLLVV
jgi:hypothetical protein